MEIYTKDDELPEDIAKHGDDRVDTKTLPKEHKKQLESWGVDVKEQIKREEDGPTHRR